MLRNPRVLIIHEAETDLTSLSNLLDALDCITTKTSSIDEAAQIATNGCDVVLVDPRVDKPMTAVATIVWLQERTSLANKRPDFLLMENETFLFALIGLVSGIIDRSWKVA